MSMKKSKSPSPIHAESIVHSVLKTQKERLDLPKRLSLPVREICLLQYRFQKRRGKQPFRLLAHPRFRAAYDLLVLRAKCGEPVQELCDWWTNFQLNKTLESAP